MKRQTESGPESNEDCDYFDGGFRRTLRKSDMIVLEQVYSDPKFQFMFSNDFIKYKSLADKVRCASEEIANITGRLDNHQVGFRIDFHIRRKGLRYYLTNEVNELLENRIKNLPLSS